MEANIERVISDSLALVAEPEEDFTSEIPSHS